jgi:replication-associated recombination protein RarA
MKSQLREFVKQVIKEEEDYQQLFKTMLNRHGKSIVDMSDDDKKKFFNAVDKAFQAKNEGKLRGYNEAELSAGQKKLDVDKDGEIEGSDLAKLRKDESKKKK